MTRQDKPRPSLIELFSAPDARRRGVFGLVCGLSSDEYFIDAALDQFSGLGRNQRQYNGHLSLALFLDAHSAPMQHMPGLYIPWQNRLISGKTGLMHAKVALLGFGESATGEPDYYRLIVSTGNWTIEAVDHNINLVWSCNFDITSNEDQRQSARDITESVFFWRKLLGIGAGARGYYQLDWNVAGKRIEKFLKLISNDIRAPKRGYAPQFISNLLSGKADRTAGLFNADSIGAQVLKHFYASRKRRNFIICASGFFEQLNSKTAKSKKQEPAVLCKIIEHLKKGILTEKAEQWLVVNPDTSGAAGQWIKSNKADDLFWWIRSPKHPDKKETPYPFHAKYIFLGNYNYTNTPITSGILYIGSGNLSKQGFVLGPGAGGNIEAGVVIRTTRIVRISELCKQLGIGAFDDELNAKDIPDQPEGEELESPAAMLQVPPPIAACVWRQEAGKLQWSKWEDLSYEDVLLHGHSIHSPGCTEIDIVGKDVDFNRGVMLSARKNSKHYNWTIPVFRDNGTFWTPPAQPKTGMEVIDTITEFPKCAYEDASNDPEDIDCEIAIGENHASTGSGDNLSEFREELDSYPLHFATTLVEVIATQNQQIPAGQMSDWAQHLRRTLIDEIKTKTKERLAELDMDILSPLIKTTGFAPPNASREYRKAIRDISDNWAVLNRKRISP